jgi:septal ring factor EnvC (AmiA/AmiB activator)
MTEREKYERVVNDLLEQISERNKRIADLTAQIKESEQREKKMNEQVALLLEQVNHLKQQLAEGSGLRGIMRQFRRRFLGERRT